MALPTTAAELNHWLDAKFTTLDGPPRAFFEIPIDFEVLGMRGGFVHRISYVTVIIAAPKEEIAVRAIARALDLMAEGEVLFFRKRFECEAIRPTDDEPGRYPPGTVKVRGRASFWNPVLNGNFQYITPEGMPAIYIEGEA